MPAELASAPFGERANGELELVERARARSPEAWTTIYDRHYQAIFRYAHARVFDPEVAADLTSNVFVAALNNITSYRYTGRPILAWLYRIARNVVADHQREVLGGRRLGGAAGPARLLAQAFTRRLSHDTDPNAASVNRSEADVSAERIDLHRAVARLPEQQREVLTLRFFVGLGTEEIGAVLGKERSAVYSLHARAIASLKRMLAPEAD